MGDKAILSPFDDVADSTDWLSTPLPGLAAVEASLRCQVCKDFYKTPMLTSCNHTFCSACIRRSLSNDGKCPLCRTSEQETKLRNNWSMEEVVTAFTKTRSEVLLCAKRSQAAGAESAKRKLEEAEDSDSTSQQSEKRLRTSTRLSKSKSMEMTSEMARLEADILYQDPADCEPDDGLVPCPICWQRMKPLQVDKHIDTSCPGERQPQKTPSKPGLRSTNIPTTLSSSSSSSSPQKPSNPPERMPAINYAMIRESQLKKKLHELGLSTSGSRRMLERRHKEWTTIWNANCDSQYPRRKAELLQDLDVWERTMGTRVPLIPSSVNLGTQIRSKNFDGAAWAAKHDTTFKELIANARRNRAPAEQQASDGAQERSDRDDKSDKSGESKAEGDGKQESTPQPDTEMIASLEHSEEPQEQVDSVTQATGVIDLTGEVASSDAVDAELSDGDGDDNGNRADLDASSKMTTMS